MKNKKVVLIIALWSIILIIVGATYAYWTWQSNNAQKTMVTFTVNAGFTCSADAGGNITSSNVRLAPSTCTNSTYAIQRTLSVNASILDASSIDVVAMDLWLDINLLDSGLAATDNFRYAVTNTQNNCSDPIVSGSFNGKQQGDRVKLLDGKEYNQTTNETYYLYIWLDEAEESQTTMNQRFNFSVSGECSKNKFTYFYYDGDSYQEYEVEDTGYYKIETWGAQGGTASSKAGGKGGYSSGYLYMTAGEKYYVYVGKQGATALNSTATGGYNGGGQATTGGSNDYSGSGGGATDIRYFSSTPSSSELAWDSTSGLNSRIMVAGGGGGAYYHSSYNSVGGAAGGLGASVVNVGTCSGRTYTAGSAAIQTAGGTANKCASDACSGSFGVGGGCGGNWFSGGGGGYYGGGSGYAAGGGGGSSFISGYSGSNAITASDDRTHTANTLHYSNKYFIDGKMVAGVNEGNGKAKLTYVGTSMPKAHTSLDNVRYIKDCINGGSANSDNHWVEIQAIRNGSNVALNKTVTGTVTASSGKDYTRIVDGDITSSNYAQSSSSGYQCVTVDLGQTYNLDEVAVWHYYTDGRTYNNNVTYVSSDNSEWLPIMASTASETANGTRVSAYSTENLLSNYVLRFKYTGSFKTDFDNTVYAANSTYATNWYPMFSPSYRIYFLSSGYLTVDTDAEIDAFLVGGGGADMTCVWDVQAGTRVTGKGGGGYHTVFTTDLVDSVDYLIVVGPSQGDTVAFGTKANRGGNGYCRTASQELTNGAGGSACGEFEASGSTYSGSGSGANTGKPNSSGIVIIRNAR